MGDWAELLPDLLILIAKRIHEYEDFVAFSGVCRSWRCVAVKENFDLSVQIPWLMLSTEVVVGSHQRFVSLSKGSKVRRVFLPEARGKHCISSMGWLISTDQQYNNMELLHPLTGRQIPLPPCSDSCRPPVRAILSASPSYTDDYVVMVIIASRLYFWKPGNKVWKMFGLSMSWYDVVYYKKDQFYAIDTDFSLFLLDTNSGNVRVVGHASPSMLYRYAQTANLVKSAYELLLVFRRRPGWGVRTTVRVYKYCDSAGMMNNKWQEIDKLGGESIFVGCTAATAVPVNAATEIKPDCIYFSWDTEIYNLETRTIESMPQLSSTYFSSTWVIPSF